jgi:hypothetical protein
MLSQHFRRTLATAHATSSLPRHQLARRLALAGPSRLPATSRAFTASSRRQDDAPRSPFQIFVNTLREELQKNRDLQDNVKQLQGDVDRLQDSEAMKRARDAYERARVCLFDMSHIIQTLFADSKCAACHQHQGKSPFACCCRGTQEAGWQGRRCRRRSLEDHGGIRNRSYRKHSTYHMTYGLC